MKQVVIVKLIWLINPYPKQIREKPHTKKVREITKDISQKILMKFKGSLGNIWKPIL
jgi:hypothetical protein